MLIELHLRVEKFTFDIYITIIEKIYPLLQDRILFGVGNIHGQGEEFIEKLLSMSTDDNSLPRQNQTLVEENKETKMEKVH